MIPAGARKLGPGMYGDGDAFHVDLDEFIAETGGDPASPQDRAAAQRALARVAAQRGIPLEVQWDD